MSPSHPKFLRSWAFCLLLIVFGGILSGLQQALMQISKAQLTAAKREGTEDEKKVARLLEPIVRRRHLTLVCLLIGNAVMMEALPVFMDMLVPRAVAIIMSVSAVVIFSEVIPQAVCLKWPLELAAFFSWLVYLLIGVLYPIAAPIAFLLDKMFGEEHEQILTKGGLRALAIAHGKIAKDGSSATLNKHELGVIVGALDLHKLNAAQCGTSLEKAFMISSNDDLDDDMLFRIMRSGHSRVPVYRGEDRTQICGLVLVKQLIRVDRKTKVRDLDLLRPVLVAKENASLFVLFNRFCRGESHMAVIVSDDTANALIPGSIKAEDGIRLCNPREVDNLDAKAVTGIITLEDVLEKMLKMDIKDETDDFRAVTDDIESRLMRLRGLKRRLNDPTENDALLPVNGRPVNGDKQYGAT